MLPRFWKCRSSSRSCSIKKVVLKNFAIFTRLQHRFFLVNIAEFLIAPILKNFCQQLLLVNGLRRKIVEKSRREHPGRIYFERVVLTAWKVSKYGVISGPYFPAFGLNTERYASLRIQSKCGKIRTRNNSVFAYFSRSVWAASSYLMVLIN